LVSVVVYVEDWSEGDVNVVVDDNPSVTPVEVEMVIDSVGDPPVDIREENSVSDDETLPIMEFDVNTANKVSVVETMVDVSNGRYVPGGLSTVLPRG